MKPIFNKQGLIYFREENDNNYTIMLKSHPELQQLKINRLTYEILQSSNGENTIDDIVNSLLKKYKKVDRNTVLHDLLDNLHMLYRMNLIYWENGAHPFEPMYNFAFGDYKLKIVDAEVVTSIFSNEKYDFYNNTRLKPDIVFGKTSLEQNIFSFNHTYIKIIKDEEFVACIGIGMIENNANCFEILRMACTSDFDIGAISIVTNPKLIKQCVRRIKKFTAIGQDRDVVKFIIDTSNAYIIETLLANGWIDSSVDEEFINKNNLNKTFYIRV